MKIEEENVLLLLVSLLPTIGPVLPFHAATPRQYIQNRVIPVMPVTLEAVVKWRSFHSLQHINFFDC